MIAVLSHNISETFEKKTHMESLPLFPHNKMDIPVSTHADMLICTINHTVFCYKDYLIQNNDLFRRIEKQGYSIIGIKKICEKSYPDDISLNCLILGNTIVGNERYIADEIKEYSSKNNYRIINVNQGYTACSSLILDENHIITSDKSIYNALTGIGKDVLLLGSGFIKLEGYNYGFIGGAGCVTDRKVYFFGKIENYPFFEQIKDYLIKNNYSYESISESVLTDYGGAKFF